MTKRRGHTQKADAASAAEGQSHGDPQQTSAFGGNVNRRGVSHAPFRKADVVRAIKAVNVAVIDGQKRVRAVQFDPAGGFTLIVGKPGEASTTINDLDKWIEKHNADEIEGN